MFSRAMTTTAVLASLAFSPAFAESHQENAKPVKPVEEVDGKRLGKLNCNVEGGWGLLVGSSKKATCAFEKADGSSEAYSGKLNKLGIDIGKTEDAYMSWVVFTQADVETGPNALAGSYTGVSGEVSLGIGLGANALVGGAGQKIGLQPVLVAGNNGLNLAVGLASLSLEATN